MKNMLRQSGVIINSHAETERVAQRPTRSLGK